MTKTTQKRYNDMLEVLPPAAMSHGRFAGGDTFACFLVGEPTTHNKQGQPLYASYWASNDLYYWGEDMTITALYDLANEPDKVADMIENADEPAENSDDARILEAYELNGVEITDAYADAFGWDYVTADKVSDAFVGEYESDESFAREMAESTGAIKDDAQWPYTCIDWELAARDLMYDYTESNGYYFNNY
jgi:hypothetical protein